MSLNPLYEGLQSVFEHDLEEPASVAQADRILKAIYEIQGGVPSDVERELNSTSQGLQGFVATQMKKAQRSEEKFIKMSCCKTSS